MTGAKQWRASCRTCRSRWISEGSQKSLVFHSEVSHNNAQYFISEERVGDRVTEEDLLSLLERYDRVLVCNVCGGIKTS